MKCPLLIIAGVLTVDCTFAADVFDASPEVRVVRERSNTSKTKDTHRQAAPSSQSRRGDSVKLRVGEIREVFRSSKLDGPEMAFYLPPEGVRIVQVVVESKGTRVSYMLKALKPGRTVGGAVERQWLDREGFQARNSADEARIQAAVKRNPLHIEVQ
jgi:hypothetical protein